MIYTPISVTTRAISWAVASINPSTFPSDNLISSPPPPLSLPVLRRREMEDNNKNVWDKRITPEEDEEEEGEEEGVGGEEEAFEDLTGGPGGPAEAEATTQVEWVGDIFMVVE